MPIKAFDGSALAAGGLVANGRYLLTSNGVNWYMLQATATNTASSSNCANILGFGGVGDGTTDNVPAWNAARAQNKCIMFPAGVFRFNGSLGYTFAADTQALTIRGAGTDNTELYWPNSVGEALQVNYVGGFDGVSVKDLTMTTGTLGQDEAILLNQTATGTYPIQSGLARNLIENVTFRAHEGYWNQNPATPVAHGWKTAIHDIGVSTVDVVGVAVFGPTPTGSDGWAAANAGEGFLLQHGGLGVASNVFNFDRVNFNWLNNGIHISGNSQGYQISLSNFTGNRTGVNVDAGLTNMAQLSITTSQFNNLDSIALYSIYADVQITNSTFLVNPTGLGIALEGPQLNNSITGNIFTGNATTASGTGIFISPTAFEDSNVPPSIITGNVFNRLVNGVTMNGNACGWNIHSNTYFQTTTNITNLDNSCALTAITGSTQSNVPSYGFATGAVNNGSGFVRVTLPSTSTFFNGQMVLAGGFTGLNGIGPNEFVVTPIFVIDSTHLDLLQVQYGGAGYTSGGTLTSLP